ncbi:MAG: macrolide 2'-phosphotransferase [Labilithrix sp.]|nr:macrolide 2'-phosphotransferase [Labilithrix sp.]
MSASSPNRTSAEPPSSPNTDPPDTASPRTISQLLEATRRHGLELATSQSDFDRTGLDFLVVHATDEHGARWIVRTPRRPELLEAVRIEARVLALVASRLPVAVPMWRLVDDDVIAYPRVAGTPAVTVDPTGGPTWNVIDPASVPDAFLDSYAAMLSALQSVDADEAAAAGVPVRPIAETRAALGRAMEATREALAPSEAVWRRWQTWLADDGLWPQHVALVHGDLHPGHMLLDDGARLVGVLDWTEAQLTDPSVDLAMFFGCFGRAALDALVRRFERAGGRVWPRLAEHAAERWAAFPALAAEWALRTGNDGALEHARGHLASTAGLDA